MAMTKDCLICDEARSRVRWTRSRGPPVRARRLVARRAFVVAPSALDCGRWRRYIARMSKWKLTYFDAPVSRGEECRLALHVAGVDFDDVRITRDAWAELKPSAPFGTLPFLEVDGKPVIGQTNAILALIGRLHGMHPSDPFEAARHEAVMAHVEDLRGAVGPTVRITDADEKRRAREGLVEHFFPTWGALVERQIGEAGFFAGDTPHVVDMKLHMAVRWFASGNVDHIPATVFSGFPRLMRVYHAVDAHPRVRDWRARS